MKILVVAHCQNDGSPTAIFIHDQVKEYVAMGHEILVLSPIALGKRDFLHHRFHSDIYEIDQVVHIILHHFSLSNYGKNGINQRSAIFSAHRWMSYLKNFQPDVIHAHTLGLDSELGAWLKEKLHCPLVVTTHGSDTFVPYTKGEYEKLKRYADRADMLICVSTLLKKRLLECHVTAPMKIILNGFHMRGSHADTAKEEYSIVQAGYLIERKKADITIRAYAELKQNYPAAKLTIVGSGDQLSRYQALCGELGVTDSVHFRGFLPNNETLAEMSKAQFFCMPSVREGFGIVYLEAMASGCITIGTQGEGIADLIETGKNGFLVPPENPRAIEDVIDWCLSHPAEADAIAQRGRADALALTWERNAMQYTQLFQRLIEREKKCL